MFRKIASIVIVLVLALCTAGAAFALPLDPEAAEAPAGSGLLLSNLWEWLVERLEQMSGAGESLDFSWAQDGCHIDPNGGCVSSH